MAPADEGWGATAVLWMETSGGPAGSTAAMASRPTRGFILMVEVVVVSVGEVVEVRSMLATVSRVTYHYHRLMVSRRPVTSPSLRPLKVDGSDGTKAAVRVPRSGYDPGMVRVWRVWRVWRVVWICGMCRLHRLEIS